MDEDALDKLFGLRSHAPAASLSKAGDAVSGTILAVEETQQTTISGDLKWFDAEETQPMMQVVVTLQTDERNDEEDDGVRRVFLKGAKSNSKSAFGSVVAALAASGDSLRIGGRLGIRVTGFGTPTKKGFSAPKEHEAVYEGGE